MTDYDFTDASLVQLTLRHIKSSRYQLAAGCMAWLYDIFLTLDDEIAMVWHKTKQGRSIVKVLYLIVRTFRDVFTNCLRVYGIC